MSREGKRQYYIGANGSGKTYRLKQIQFENPDQILYFDENGLLNSINIINNVKIIDDTYLYIDDTTRGSLETEKNLSIKIEVKLLEPLRKIDKAYKKLVNMRKSPGIEKLLSITRELLSRNLNNIDTIVIDEPESLLDDENLKVLIGILEMFKGIGVHLVYATHSSRFLELSLARIDEIIVLGNNIISQNIYNISYEEIKEMFIRISEEIFAIEEFNESEVNGNMIIGKLRLRNKGLETYLDSILYSNDFYRCLFYSDVILAEGLTEKLLISSMPAEKMKNKNFYFTNGKVYMPFFIELFQKMGLKVRVVFDSDIDEKRYNLARELTYFMKNKYDNPEKVILITTENKDIECDYNIGNHTRSKFKDESNLSRKHAKNNYFKPYIALYAFLENEVYYEDFITSIFPTKDTSEYEFD